MNDHIFCASIVKLLPVNVRPPRQKRIIFFCWSDNDRLWRIKWIGERKRTHKIYRMIIFLFRKANEIYIFYSNFVLSILVRFACLSFSVGNYIVSVKLKYVERCRILFCKFYLLLVARCTWISFVHQYRRSTSTEGRNKIGRAVRICVCVCVCVFVFLSTFNCLLMCECELVEHG